MTHPTALPNKAALDAIDRAHLIHPVSPWRVHEERGPTVLASGRGAWLTDANGHELLDAFAGLWCVNVGYGQESVVQAAAEQMRRLPYATGYFHFSSEPAIRLAEKLVQITPASLTRVYLTLGGSEAIDAAVRFIVQYHNAIGKPTKKQFIALERGYHGSSSTGAGLTALPAFHRGFDLPLPTQHYIPSPNPYRHADGADPQALIAAVGRVAAREGGRAGRGQRGRLLLRADPGLGRRHRAAQGLAEGHARGHARARHPLRRRRGHHRLRPHRPDVRVRGRGRGARPDDHGQGPDRRLRADGRDDDVGAGLCRHCRWRPGRRLDRPRRHVLRRTRSAPRSRWRCCACTRKAACSPTASAARPISRPGSMRSARTRWWAMRATAACWAPWSW